MCTCVPLRTNDTSYDVHTRQGQPAARCQSAVVPRWKNELQAQPYSETATGRYFGVNDAVVCKKREEDRWSKKSQKKAYLLFSNRQRKHLCPTSPSHSRQRQPMHVLALGLPGRFS